MKIDEARFWRELEEILNKLEEIEEYDDPLEVLSDYRKNGDEPGDNIKRIIEEHEIFDGNRESYKNVAEEVSAIENKYGSDFVSEARERIDVDWLPRW